MRNKIVKTQHVKSIDANNNYWKYADVFPEALLNPQANPDLLESLSPSKESEQLLAILTVLSEGGEQVLTAKQKRAFQLVVREGLSLRKAGQKMRCNEATVREHIELGAVKLRKLTLAKTA